MKENSWEKAKKIFADAIKLAPELRLAYLNEVCVDDAETRREVESLLASYEEAKSFMEMPAGRAAADVIYPVKNLEKGKCFGHYEIIEKIGTGGMGEVYLARDKKLDRKVGVKILNEKFRGHDSNLYRFISEAKAASALNHPNILVVHEFGETDEAHYIVSEFVKGKTLRETLRDRSLPLAEILDMAIQIAAALSAAHEAHLVHRDIKPENVMIRDDGIIKVLDFGLAKLVGPSPAEAEAVTKVQTETGMILGTVNYMSPEQARGLRVDARTDIFSFGCVLYEMLTRRQAFTGETINHTIVAILEKEPPPVGLFIKDYPAEIEKVIEKCLRKNPAERYGSAKELTADLKALNRRLEFEAELERSAAPNKETQAVTQPFEPLITAESPTPSPNNLPEPPEPIVGREKEVSEIKDLLRQPNVRLITLTGVGGAGKTRLALAVAQDLLADFPDGVFFVELSAVTDAELVASTIAQPLGVKEAGGRPLLEILKDYLADKRMLLVLDNFEQVIAAAPRIRELLKAPRLKIVITSRALLRLSVEREYIVPPLAAPAERGETSLEKIAGYEAVKLFVERARQAKRGFVLTGENTAAVGEICARLDGLPLAIELAAARVRILDPPAILAKLENRLKLLTGGASDLPARQQTMRGAIEWSFNLLGEDEKNLFRRLSVFAGGFTFEAAEAVCGSCESGKEPIDFLDLVTSLVDKNLLAPKEHFDGAGMRFRMLEVVREYALESLKSSGEIEATRRAHAEYFLALGEEAEPHLQAVQSVDWLNRLEAEQDNLRAALSWSLENDAGLAARLSGSLTLFWNFHGHLAEGQKWFDKVLGSQSDISPNTRWKILYGSGLIAILQGNYRSGRKILEQSRETANLAGDRRRAAMSANTLAMALFELGNLREAKTLTEESLAIGKQLNDKYVIARALLTSGELSRSEDDYRAARRFYEEALGFFEQIGIKNGLAGTLINLGAITYLQGDLIMARFYYEKGLEMCCQLGLKVLMICCLDGFAALSVKQGESDRALKLSGAAEALGESIGFVSEKEDRRFRDAYLAEVKSTMDEADFSKFYKQGRKMKLEESLELIRDLSHSAEKSIMDENLETLPVKQ